MEYRTWLEHEQDYYTVILDDDENENASSKNGCEPWDLEDRVYEESLSPKTSPETMWPHSAHFLRYLYRLYLKAFTVMQPEPKPLYRYYTYPFNFRVKGDK